MRRGPGIAVAGLVLAGACAVAWWRERPGGQSDPATDATSGDIDAERASRAPPPPLASPGLDRRARAEARAPVAAPAGPASAPGDGRVRGQVLDADGNPVVGAIVQELAASEPPAVTTDADGRFDLALTAPLPRGLLVRAPGLADEIVTASASAAGVSISLAKGWTIAGTVVAPATDVKAVVPAR